MTSWAQQLDDTLAGFLGGDPLAIYLQDHLAGATFGLELARRAQRANEDSEFGEFLDWLATQLAEDRRTLLGLMAELGVHEDRLKSALAWAAEKAGRLKPNGRLVSYSPLSRVLELEGLIGGVNGKLALWHALRTVAGHDGRLDAETLDRLIERAEQQLSRLHENHRAACALTF